MKPSTLIEFLKFSAKHRRPVLIKAKAGVGKTDCTKEAVRQLDAEDRELWSKEKGKNKRPEETVGCDLIIMHPVVSDPTDGKGLPWAFKDANGEMRAEFIPYGDLRKMMEAKRLTVVLLDDLGQAPPSVQASFMQLILARELNGKKLSDKVTFVSCTNRKQDKAGVVGVLEPVKSRFGSIVELDVDASDWCDWAVNHNMPIELVAFIRFKPAILDSAVATNDITNSPSPRTVTNAGNYQNDGLPQELEYEVFMGSAGETFAIEYTAFLKLYREMPDIQNILLNPDKVNLPPRLDLQYALCGALVNKADDTYIDNIIKYVKRMPVEFHLFFQKDLGQRKPDLMKTRAFIKWVAESGNRTVK